MPHFAPIHQATDGPTSPDWSDSKTYLAFAAAALLAGGNPVAVRIGYAELAPFWGAALRFLGAGVILFVAVAVLRLALPRGRALVGVLLYGLLNFGAAFMFIYWALTEVTAGTAMVILATVPLLTLTFAVAEGLERFSVRSIAGAVTAAIGIGLVFSDSIGTASPAALAALLGGAASMAAAAVVIKKFPRVHAVVENALGMAVGGGLLLGLSLVTVEPRVFPVDPGTQLSLLYLIVLGSIGVFLLYMFVLRRLTASGATYILLLAPLAAVTLGAVLLGEPVHSIFLIGGALVLAGVYVGVIGHAASTRH